MSTLWHRFWRREDGVAAIEFALIAPIVLILFVGMVNVGFRFYEESRLNQATRETAEAAMFTRNLTSLQAVLDSQLASLGRSVGGEPFTGTVTLACQCVDPAQPGQCAIHALDPPCVSAAITPSPNNGSRAMIGITAIS